MSAERDRLAAMLLLVLHDLHPVYGNTSYRGRGIGGATITAGCSVNHPEDAEYDLLNAIETTLRAEAQRMEREGTSIRAVANAIKKEPRRSDT